MLVQSVEEVETRSGKIRYVLRDGDGREYTTFRPAIGREAAKFEGRRARIAFHEEERNGFNNVYLDRIDEAAPAPSPGASTDPDEVAWSTAVEAAPWVLGSSRARTRDPAGGALREAGAVQAPGRRRHPRRDGARGRLIRECRLARRIEPTRMAPRRSSGATGLPIALGTRDPPDSPLRRTVFSLPCSRARPRVDRPRALGRPRGGRGADDRGRPRPLRGALLRRRDHRRGPLCLVEREPPTIAPDLRRPRSPPGAEPGALWESMVHADDWAGVPALQPPAASTAPTAKTSYRVIGLDGVTRG